MDKPFLVATYADEASLRGAVRTLRTHGVRIADVFMPYPVHGLDEIVGLRRSRLPIVTLAAGALGLATALAMQFYMAVLDWPLNVGGKPANSTLAFVPITFELTVLFAALATAAAFLVRSRLVPGARARAFAEGATEDVFAVVIRQRDGTLDIDEARRLLQDSGARDVALTERPR